MAKPLEFGLELTEGGCPVFFTGTWKVTKSCRNAGVKCCG